MFIYRITITNPDRSRARCTGLFATAFDAVIALQEAIPSATSVCAIRVEPQMPCEKNCNQGRLCPANNGRGRTCDELGVCQSRPGCQDKDKGKHDTEKLPPGGHWFSPGSLDGPYQDTKRVSARRVAVALYLAVGTAAAVAVAGFAAGYFNIPGMLR